MSGLTVKSGLRKGLRHTLCGALLVALGGCAQMQSMGGYLVARVSGQAATANSAAPARQNAVPAAQAATQQVQKLQNEKRVLANNLQAAEKTALLVQIEGGDITLTKAPDLPSCQIAQVAISGMPGREKQAVPPYRSAFSVGSVSPYTPRHLLISTCLPLARIAPL